METGNWKIIPTTVAVTHKAATQIQIQIQIRTWRSQEINISVDWHARPLRVKCDSVSSFVWHSLDVFKSESIPKQINDLICIHRITKNQKKAKRKQLPNVKHAKRASKYRNAARWKSIFSFPSLSPPPLTRCLSFSLGAFNQNQIRKIPDQQKYLIKVAFCTTTNEQNML